ncbi:hypothetical protein B0T24DRAFT_515064 [Lasiosphaeria ovina]|uniref:DNA/RNA-binding protein Alba-like domain-containing protein n=1 Tax=Lasiosphaeria ovina TaxID=92902 RepID=A0AAE0NLZ3_9PEZI|nr:hypothetical protein B0T24DRAFT_515064 [Lasiosphaeria ovina]
MPTAETIRPQTQILSKRKHLSDNNDPNPKKVRVAGELATALDTTASPAASPFTQLHESLVSILRPRYEVKTMSVMSSTSINKHVDKALNHLGRFSMWDQSVLPGVVLLSAKASASSKLITISELVRRRIGESEQKWYQYNVLNESLCEPTAAERPREVVEDTFMEVDPEHEPGNASDSEDYFETTVNPGSIHERATQPAKTRHVAFMSIFLSRVPLGELNSLPNIILQTNEKQIEYVRKKKAGLVG